MSDAKSYYELEQMTAAELVAYAVEKKLPVKPKPSSKKQDIIKAIMQAEGTWEEWERANGITTLRQRFPELPAGFENAKMAVMIFEDRNNPGPVSVTVKGRRIVFKRGQWLPITDEFRYALDKTDIVSFRQGENGERIETRTQRFPRQYAPIEQVFPRG